MGVPFTPISATKSLILTEDVNDDGVVGYGDTIRYDIEIVNVGPSDIGVGLIFIQDTLDENVNYVPGSTFYVDHDGNSIPVSDDESGTPFPLDGDGIPSKANLPQGAIHHIKFSVGITTDGNVHVIVNTGTAQVWGNKLTFENKFPLFAPPKTIDIEDICIEEL